MTDHLVLMTADPASVAHELQGKSGQLHSDGAITLYAQAVISTDHADVPRVEDSFTVLPELARRLGPDATGFVTAVDEPTTDALDALAAGLGSTVSRWPAEDVLAEVHAAQAPGGGR